MKLKISQTKSVEFGLKESFYTVLIICFLVATMFARIISHSNFSMQLSAVLLIGVGFLGIVKLILEQNKLCIFYVVFIILSWLFMFALKLGNIFYEYNDFISSVFFAGLAYLLLTNNSRVLLFKGMYYLVVLYFFVEIILLRTPIRGLLADGNSYNYISCYIIIYYSIYALVLMKNGKYPDYLDSAIFVITIFFTYGRGGIVSAAFYAVGFVFIKLHEKNTKIYTYLIVLVIALIVFKNYENIVTLLIQNTNLQKFVIYGMESNGRSELWQRYLTFSGSSFVDFLTGADPRLIFSDGNLHNSFLQMWGSFGFIFMSSNIVLLVIILHKRIREKNLYYVLILGTFLVRAFTDKMMYRWYGEIILYYCIFDYLLSRNKRRSLEPSNMDL